MHRQYAKTEDVLAETVALARDAARHLITVLRLDLGDEVELFDGNGASAVFVIDASAPTASAAERPERGLSSRELLREGRLRLRRKGSVCHAKAPAFELILGACVSKSSRMDWTIEKAAELGAARIVPIVSQNCVVRFKNGADCDEHRDRWQRIAIDAARQCSSPFVAKVERPAPFADALAALTDANAAIFAGALTHDAAPFKEVLAHRATSPNPCATPPRVAWIVGPEGDFSPEEYECLRKAGASLVSLGSRILRTETAAIAGLCIINSELSWSIDHE